MTIFERRKGGVAYVKYLNVRRRAVEEITEIQKVFQPTVKMQNVWDASHAEYVDKFAWIKRMLEM